MSMEFTKSRLSSLLRGLSSPFKVTMHALLFACLSIINFSSYAVQSNTVAATSAKGRAVIQRRKTVLVRSAEFAKEFPNRKTAVISYPVISGLNPTVLRRVRSLLALKNIFDYSLEEYRNDAWLTEFSYVVNHNADYLLDITFTHSGVAAYPDDQSKHYLIDLRDGSIVNAADAFQSDKLRSLTALVDSNLQQEIAQLRKDNAKDADPSDQGSINDAYENLKFEIKELDEFSVTKKGITFLYDAGFPHAIKALEPQGRYFFTYTQLKPYIKADGPLGKFIR